MEVPDGATALEMEAGSFVLCIVRFDSEIVGRVGAVDLLADGR